MTNYPFRIAQDHKDLARCVMPCSSTHRIARSLWSCAIRNGHHHSVSSP